MTTTPSSAPDPGVAPGAQIPADAALSPGGGARTSPLAILAFVATFLVPLAGIIMGHRAMAQTRRTGEPGHRLALVATVLGYIFTAIVLMVLVLVAVVPLLTQTGSPTYSKF